MADRTPPPPPGSEARAEYEKQRSKGADDQHDPEVMRLLSLARAEVESGEPDASLLHHLGLMLDHRLGQPRQALDYYLSAHRLSQGDIAHVQTLRWAFAQRNNWMMVARLTAEQAEKTSSARRAAELLCQQGVVLEQRLSEPAGAAQCYRDALDRDPDNRQAELRLHRLLWREGAADELVDLCERAAERTSDPARAALLHYERGVLLEERLGNVAAAQRAYAQALPADVTPAADALVRTMIERQQWDNLARLLDEDATRQAPGTVGASDLLVAAVRCAHDLGDVDRAGRLLHRALSGSSALAPYATTLVSGEPDPEGVQRLVNWTERWAVDEQDDARRARLLFDLGLLYDHGLGADGEARRCFGESAALDPDFGPAHTALFRQLQASGRWTEAAELCGAALSRQALSAEHRVWQLRLADCIVRQGAVAHSQGQWSSLEGALSREPLLLDLQTRRAWWRGDIPLLVEAMGEAAERTKDPAHKKALLVDRATLLEHHPDQGDAARAWRLVLTHDAGQVQARRHLAACLQREARQRGGDPDTGAWATLQAATEQEDPSLRVEPAVGLAYGLEASGALAGAAAALAEAAELGGSWLLWREVRRLYTRLEAWSEVVRCLDQEAAACGVVSTEVDTLLELARLSEEHLDDDVSTERALSRALELAPGDERAAEAMERRLRESGRWSELVEVLSRREAHYDALPPMLERQHTRAKLLSRMAHILEDRLGDTAGAAGLLARATDLWPQNPALWLHRAKLLGIRREAVDATEALRQVMATSEDPQMLYQASLALGNLLDNELGQPDQAVGWLQNALTLRPGDPTALERLHGLFARRRDWFNLAGVLEQQLAALDDPEQREALSEELAGVRRRLFGQAVDRSPTPRPSTQEGTSELSDEGSGGATDDEADNAGDRAAEPDSATDRAATENETQKPD